MKRPVYYFSHHASNMASQLKFGHSPDSRLGKVRRFLSSPLARKKNAIVHKTFNVPLNDLMERTPGKDVPHIVEYICCYLEKNALSQEGIFRVSGNAKLIEKLRNQIDETGKIDFTEGQVDVFSIGGLLKLFLRELPDPLIPNLLSHHFIIACKDGKGNKSNLRQLSRLISLLPDANFNLLKYLIVFLAKVAQNKQQNLMHAQALGIVFGPNLFRVSSGLDGLKDQGVTNDVVTLFIEHHETIFEKVQLDYTDAGKPLVPSKSTLLRLRELRIKSLGIMQSRNDSDINEVDSAPSSSEKGAKHKSDPSTIRLVELTIEDAVGEHLFFGNSTDSGQRTEYVFRPFSLSDGAEIIYKDEMSTNKERLKRSKSNDEVSNIAKQSSSELKYYQPNDDSVFNSVYPFCKMLHCMTSKSSPPRAKHLKKARNQQSNVGLAPQEILNYDSDEMHDMKRKSERFDPIRMAPGRIRRRSGSFGKKSSKSSKPDKREVKVEEAPEEDAPHQSSIPELDLSKLHVHGNGSDPIPSEQHACSSWQFANLSQDADSQAVVPCPRTSHLLQKSSDDMEIELPPEIHIEKRHIQTGVLKEVEETLLLVKFLRRKAQRIKKKIKSFEIKFEASRGYKPSHAEKLKHEEAVEHISVLDETNKDIKFLQEQGMVSSALLSSPPPVSSIPSLTFYEDDDGVLLLTIDEEVAKILRRLAERRINTKAPEAIEKMSRKEARNELHILKKSINQLQQKFGRPSENKKVRDATKVLYERFQRIKLRFEKLSSPKKLSRGENINTELIPILEDSTLEFADVSGASAASADVVDDEDHSEGASAAACSYEQTEFTSLAGMENLTSQIYPAERLHELTLSQLIIQYNLLSSLKQRVKRKIFDHDMALKRKYGREGIKDDWMDVLYGDYKELKSRCRLIDALITKHMKYLL